LICMRYFPTNEFNNALTTIQLFPDVARQARYGSDQVGELPKELWDECKAVSGFWIRGMGRYCGRGFGVVGYGPPNIPQNMPQQIAFLEAHEPQQTANNIRRSLNNQNATRKQSERNQKATSSWRNIPQHIPQLIPQHIPQNMPHQSAFLEAQEPQQKANNQKSTRKQPDSNQKAPSSWPNIPQHSPQHIPQYIPQHMPQQRAFV
jgi:hypothetical protein